MLWTPRVDYHLRGECRMTDELGLIALLCCLRPATMKTVRNVDVQRYMGRWYEIANMPTQFQPGDSTNTMATYTLLEDGRISVVNQTFSSSRNWVGIAGTAKKAQPDSSEAKYVVNFWVPPFLPVFPVSGDYWVRKETEGRRCVCVLSLESCALVLEQIIHLDEDYQVAVVGEPRLRNCWILSRDPNMSDEEYQKVVDGPVKEAGYDTTQLARTRHLAEVREGGHVYR